MNDKAKKSGKVIIGMTGRLDSTVAAYLLKKQGYEVIGVGIVTCSTNVSSSEDTLPHCFIKSLDDIKKICDDIGIQFYATDIKSQFESEIVDPLVSNRLTAKANTSCFRCVQLRLHTLYDKMQQLKADFIATGHYAKILKNINSNKFYIHSNNDIESDQSYILAGLPENILSHLLLPLGELRREDVMKIAKRFQLKVPVGQAALSFCFTDNNMVIDIIDKKVPDSLLKEGQAVSKDSGSFMGDHDSIAFHYIGERRVHFRNSSSPLKDFEIVGYNYEKAEIQVGPPSDLSFDGTEIVRLKLSAGIDISAPISCFFKFKHDPAFHKCTLFCKNNENALVEFSKTIYPMIPHETLIFYESNGRNSKIIGIGQVGTPGSFKMVDRVAAFRPQHQDSEEEEGQEVKEAREDQKVFKF